MKEIRYRFSVQVGTEVRYQKAHGSSCLVHFNFQLPRNYDLAYGQKLDRTYIIGTFDIVFRKNYPKNRLPQLLCFNPLASKVINFKWNIHIIFHDQI